LPIVFITVVAASVVIIVAAVSVVIVVIIVPASVVIVATEPPSAMSMPATPAETFEQIVEKTHSCNPPVRSLAS